MSIEEINNWKETEIQGLKNSLLEINKELIVLDKSIEDITAFFEYILFALKDLEWNAKTIASQMIFDNKEIIDRYEKIIVLDCDKTISNSDTTYDFCEKMDIEKSKLKELFSGERYSLYQFFRTAKLYSGKPLSVYENSAEFAANQAVINENLIKDIANNGKEFLSIGITSGVLRTWQIIQSKINFPNIIFGSSNLNTENTIVSKFVRYQLIKQLKELGKYIISVGDSSIDLQMLEAADKGFIIANKKLNAGMEEYFNNTNSTILQLDYSNFQYQNIQSQKSLFV